MKNLLGAVRDFFAVRLGPSEPMVIKRNQEDFRVRFEQRHHLIDDEMGAVDLPIGDLQVTGVEPAEQLIAALEVEPEQASHRYSLYPTRGVGDPIGHRGRPARYDQEPLFGVSQDLFELDARL